MKDMDLSFNSKMEAYYQKFFELQERLKKSEEERAKLEMKFSELVQISKEEEQAHYKKLRAQYKKFLEEDRKRQERNEKIIRTLERIESRVNMLTSKTERLKILRRQYQSYMQRVSRDPAEKRGYFFPKSVEECNERKPLFDEKNSSDISMLKKAYGKTNDEKIEILDKYLQSLKSQKSGTSEFKPSETRTDSSELKYLEEVSKKLNQGFNSNEANSIVEEIMNSIYTRHYKKDLPMEQPKRTSIFTTPSFMGGNSGKAQTSYDDTYSNRFDINGLSDSLKNDYSKINNISTYKGLNNIDESPNNSIKDHSGNSQQQFENDGENNIGFDKKFENESNFTSGLSFVSDQLHENSHLPKKQLEKVYKNEVKFAEVIENPSKAETDLYESEKQRIEDPHNSTKNLAGHFENNNINHNVHKLENHAAKTTITDVIPDLTEPEISLNESASNEVASEIKQPDSSGLKQEMEINDSDNLMKSEVKELDHYDTMHVNSDTKDVIDTNLSNTPVDVESIKKYEHESDSQEVNISPEDSNKSRDKYLQYEENDDEDQHLSDQQQYEDYDRVYGEKIQPYEQDPTEQPIEQDYGENGEAIQQYDENGQLVFPNQQICGKNEEGSQQINNDSQITQEYEENDQPLQPPYQQHVDMVQPIQQYDENGQPVQPYYDDQTSQQYDPNDQPIQQYDVNGQPILQYDESSQPIQQFNENGEPVHQYDENGQPIQQYDESGQSVQQFDENGQPILQYDESGEPIQQFNENGQPVQQYDESGQPVQQYGEDGQPIQQYDESGQPIYFNQEDDFVQYDENGQIIQQYDENGQPIVQNMYDESYQNYDATGQQPVEYDGLFKETDESGQTLQQYETNQLNAVEQRDRHESSEQPHTVESDQIEKDVKQVDQANIGKGENVEPSKKKHILDLLDTDSESVKQNTSKISNDSDFDFSNG